MTCDILSEWSLQRQQSLHWGSSVGKRKTENIQGRSDKDLRDPPTYNLSTLLKSHTVMLPIPKC